VETPVGSIYEFGPFEVRPGSGELLKHGRRVKLQDQPFRLLVVLLENAGQVVTREQIQSRIWEENTFVDFDASLRVAVRKLREALGDDAENPRYIETVPKRGYRFLAPFPSAVGSVQRIEETEASPAGREAPAKSERPERWHWFAALLLLILITSATGAFLSLAHKRRVFTEKDTVVLADFANSTGDPVFDGTLRQGLTVQLEQSPFLSLISDERMQQVLHSMGQPPDARLDPQIGREVCERTGSAAVLDGSIASLGSKYVLGLQAKDCRTGKVLAAEQVQADRKEEVLNALDQIASKFRSRVGESLTTVEKYDTPLAEATTPSLEALKAYSAGLKIHSQKGSAAALPLFKHAIALDPKFAMAYANLGHAYGEIGESDLSAESMSKAYQFQDRASDREKFFITASYDFRVTGNLEKVEQACMAWAQAYPRDYDPPGILGGVVYPAFGKYQKAVEESSKAVELDPDFAIGYNDLAFDYVFLDRLGQAEKTLQLASARNLEASDALVLPYDIAFLKGDQVGMEREAAVEQAKSESEAQSWYYQAFAMAYSGHLRQARTMAARATDMAQQADQPERAALWGTGAALLEAFLADPSAARKKAKAALVLSKDREIEYGAALAFALTGDTAQAQTLANDLQRRFAEDTSVKFSYLPTLRALLALDSGESSRAIELLQVAAPYDLGAPRSSYHGIFGPLYPVYFRGEALLAAHQGPQAAAEFQKILDHRGTVVSDPIGALARLQLGRAFARSGDKARAKSAYENFLTLWKAADPDIPIFREAKQEYARLQ
jgi:DNA-binding winged helix-turn-helix (wHTH) protein/tetratricopeptide (TPR) repeat protein